MEIEYASDAISDLERIPDRFRAQILRKLGRLRDGLSADVKRLQGHDAVYRLRSGEYRAIFEIIQTGIVVLRVKHRRDAYG